MINVWWNYYKFGPAVQNWMLFKYVPICISMGQNVRAVPFEQFGSGPHERHLCVIILNLDKNLRRCCLKVFTVIISSSSSHSVQQTETVWAILVAGLMKDIYV